MTSISYTNPIIAVLDQSKLKKKPYGVLNKTYKIKKKYRLKRKSEHVSNYYTIPVVMKNAKKISNDDFCILDYKDYTQITLINYNVSQLRQMCRHYKQKISGNKKEVRCRIYNYLKLSYYCKKIQKIFRGNIRRLLNKLRGPALFVKSVNDTDFYTLEDI